MRKFENEGKFIVLRKRRHYKDGTPYLDIRLFSKNMRPTNICIMLKPFDKAVEWMIKNLIEMKEDEEALRNILEGTMEG